jgi:hypothetical protein
LFFGIPGGSTKAVSFYSKTQISLTKEVGKAKVKVIFRCKKTVIHKQKDSCLCLASSAGYHNRDGM